MAPRKRKSAATEDTDLPDPEAPASRRRSQRVSSSGQKSKYFEPDSDDDAGQHETSSAKPHARGRPPKKAKTKEEDDHEEDHVTEAQNGSDSNEEFDEDAPPKVTFIPLPKLRDNGGIEYADDRLHPNTLVFLSDLKANNKRSWLKANDHEYRRALKDWETYVMSLTDKIIEVDPTIPELPFRDVNFRIYRDIRFSNDPTPYKPHFSAAFSRTGRKGPYACYYVHVEPGGHCFVGGGLWHPDASALHKIRASIDERPRRWRRVLNERLFRETFLFPPSSDDDGGGSGQKRKKKGKTAHRKSSQQDRGGGDDDDDDPEPALKAFAEQNQEGALKTRPKGFNPEHRDMQLLKLKNFTVGKKVPDAAFTSLGGGQDAVVEAVRALVGFITHLNRIVMPDPNDSDEESDEE
ncbi:hypothetical protein VTK26DRAFT_6047 [Humicola hyalothermophila]